MPRWKDELVPDAQEGWAWPLPLAVAHYFHRRWSLCGEAYLFEHGGEPDRIDRHRWNRCGLCDRRWERVRRWRNGEPGG